MYEIALSAKEIKNVYSKGDIYYGGKGYVSDDVLDAFIDAVIEKLSEEFYSYVDENASSHHFILLEDNTMNVGHYVRRTIAEMVNWTLCNKYTGGFDDGRHTGQAIHEGEV